MVVWEITNTTPFMQHRCNMQKERSGRTQLRNPPFSVSARRGLLNCLHHPCPRHVTGSNWRRTERGRCPLSAGKRTARTAGRQRRPEPISWVLSQGLSTLAAVTPSDSELLGPLISGLRSRTASPLEATFVDTIPDKLAPNVLSFNGQF